MEGEILDLSQRLIEVDNERQYSNEINDNNNANEDYVMKIRHKFKAENDATLLELVREHNPYTIKRGQSKIL